MSQMQEPVSVLDECIIEVYLHRNFWHDSIFSHPQVAV